MTTKDNEPFSPLEIRSHRAMTVHTREISRRLNARPEIAQLMFVNAVIALEDIGVVLTDEMKQHVTDSLRFPRKLREKLVTLEAELRRELSRVFGRPCALPLSDTERADLLFSHLKLRPKSNDRCLLREISSRRARQYSREHPLIGKLAAYERGRQGAFVFHGRETYELFKRGEKKLSWLKDVRFKE